MANVVLLNDTERQSLRSVFHDEFDSELPSESQANIAAIIDNGIEAFVTAEAIIRVGMIWVRPDKRGSGHLQTLAKHLQTSIPKGSSVITIATEDKQKRYFRRLGLSEREGTIFRIDL